MEDILYAVAVILLVISFGVGPSRRETFPGTDRQWWGRWSTAMLLAIGAGLILGYVLTT
jgi:multisubunit Na+/H+ antiporter MnhB subunit